MKPKHTRPPAHPVLSILACALLAPSASADDWPQWQGPNRNAISTETGLLQEWPKDGPPLAWKATGLGGGDSAPAIAAGRIYGMANRGEDEVVWALSEKDGQETWVSRLGPAVRQRASQGREGPACTPTVDGDRLYVIGLGGDVTCLQVTDGKILWQRSLTSDFGGRVPMWSYRESPLIDGDKLICTPGSNEAMLVALDKRTGQTIWQTKRPDAWQPDTGFEGGMMSQAAADSGSRPAGPGGAPGGRGGFGGPPGGGFGRGPGGGAGVAYASAIAIDFEGKRQYVQLTAGALIGVDAANGTFLWRYDAPANRMGINCSTPIHHEGLVFAASAYGAGGGLVKLSKDPNGDIKAEEVYATRKMQNHHGGMILLEGAL